MMVLSFPASHYYLRVRPANSITELRIYVKLVIRAQEQGSVKPNWEYADSADGTASGAGYGVGAMTLARSYPPNCLRWWSMCK